MSLLLRRQGAPAAVGLEEDTPFLPVVWQANAGTFAVGEEEFVAVAAVGDDVAPYPRTFAAQPPPTFVASEEFVAVTVVDEDPGPFTLRVDSPFVFATTPSEDFTMVVTVDEPPPSVSVTWQDSFLTTQLASEDFAGSLPFDDADIGFLPTTQRPLSITIVDEEFVAPKLIDEPPLVFAVVDVWSVSQPAPTSEDFAGSLPLEESSVWPLLFESAPLWSFVANEEDFGGAHPIEDETPPAIAFPESRFVTVAVATEDFAGSLPLEEDYAFPLLPQPIRHTLSIVPEEWPGALVPPPPPPPTPLVRPRTRPLPQTGGNDLLQAPRRYEKPAVDYAIVPLVGEVVVKALADGVVETVTVGGQQVLRLTADDGTVYFYANVRGAKSGRVKKDDAIGVTKAPAKPAALPSAPKLLDDGKTIEVQAEVVEEPKAAAPSPTYGVYGVLPIPRVVVAPSTWQPPVVYRVPAVALAAPPPPGPTPLAIERKLSTGQIVLITVGVIGVSAAVAWFFFRKKPKRLPKRRRKPNLRRSPKR